MSDLIVLLKGSVDYRHQKFGLGVGIFCFVYLFVFVSIPGLFLIEYQPYATVFLLSVSFFASSPVIVWYALKMRKITAEPEKYTLCEAVLENPRTVWREIRFDVRTKDGTTYESAPVFVNSSFSERGFDEYNGKRVLAAIDIENSRVVILKKV